MSYSQEKRKFKRPPTVGKTKFVLGLRLEMESLVGIQGETGEKRLTMLREVRDKIKIYRDYKANSWLSVSY